MKKVLSIAGFDPTTGAGVQADVKTILDLGGYPLGVSTSITVQNSKKVYAKEDISPKTVKEQIEAILSDIDVDAVKIGMLGNKENIKHISKSIKDIKAPIVLDPVMISTSGCRLLDKDAIKVLKKRLLPICDLVTPNIYEASFLSGIEISSLKDMKKAAKRLTKTGAKAVLLKGGHLKGEFAVDILYKDGKFTTFKSKKIDEQKSYHGTGCVLSTAIAFYLAKGFGMKKAVKKAKKYIDKSIKKSFQISKLGSYMLGVGVKNGANQNKR
ncbi:MAG: bifunctional hydroxymethylpyrimidine kinase/phosphomethylpyrimidine kinase [Epsilonproteobacteria bacterium]|nr:bifunctional hydroxymethylpyrimidine kinase/phosphomethylpyrimidine kinase [Campylobacterota bacterium]